MHHGPGIPLPGPLFLPGHIDITPQQYLPGREESLTIWARDIIIGLAAGSYIQLREKWPWKAKAASAATPKA